MTRENRTKSGEGPHAASHAAGRDWPLDVRVRLARAVVEQHVSTGQVASQLGVPYTTAVQWVKRYRAGGEAGKRPVITV